VIAYTTSRDATGGRCPTTRAAEDVQGAVTQEQDLPIPGFSDLGVTEIQQRLRGLAQRELTAIEGYGRAHARRHDRS
jgi:hypothetical protein